MRASAIIFSSLNKNTFSRLTANRTVAAIPFACRYRLIDFSISNAVNSGIFDISIVANYNYRSLLTHIGSGKDYDLARRCGGINFVSPFQSIGDISEAKMFSTRLEALKSMLGYIKSLANDLVILIEADTVMNIDLGKVIDYHVDKKAEITFVSGEIDEDTNLKSPRMLFRAKDGCIEDIAKGLYSGEIYNEISLGTLIIGRENLIRIIEDASAHNYGSLGSYLIKNLSPDRFYSYKFRDYFATVSDFYDYYKSSLRLIRDKSARMSLFGYHTRPIYTKIHNSPPKLYKFGANVKNSLLADEEFIEGEVIDSIVFRGVKIEKGAVVRNSILFHGTHIGKGANISFTVTDKDVYISDNTVLCGAEAFPIYVEKGRRI